MNNLLYSISKFCKHITKVIISCQGKDSQNIQGNILWFLSNRHKPHPKSVPNYTEVSLVSRKCNAQNSLLQLFLYQHYLLHNLFTIAIFSNMMWCHQPIGKVSQPMGFMYWSICEAMWPWLTQWALGSEAVTVQLLLEHHFCCLHRRYGSIHPNWNLFTTFSLFLPCIWGLNTNPQYQWMTRIITNVLCFTDVSHLVSKLECQNLHFQYHLIYTTCYWAKNKIQMAILKFGILILSEEIESVNLDQFGGSERLPSVFVFLFVFVVNNLFQTIIPI